MTVPDSTPAVDASVTALGPEAAEFGGLDMAGLGGALAGAAQRAASRPAEVASALARFWLTVARTGPAAASSLARRRR